MMMQEVLRDTLVEIDLKKLANNMRLIRQLVGPDTAITAVVKANAYGHGAVGVAETLMESGADYLAVATLSEAVEIKKAYPAYPVFIMGHTPDKYLSHIVDFDITATIFSLRQAELLNELAEKAGKKGKVHIKLDTGFHRLGLDAKDRGQTLQTIRAITALPRVEAEGLFSHLALVNDEENDKQYHLFAEIADQLKTEGIHFRYYHLADSIATVDDPHFRLNMVRVGALIYGMRGFHKGFVPVEQVLTFRAAISQLHHIKEGEGVSLSLESAAGFCDCNPAVRLCRRIPAQSARQGLCHHQGCPLSVGRSALHGSGHGGCYRNRGRCRGRLGHHLRKRRERNEYSGGLHAGRHQQERYPRADLRTSS